MFYHREKKLVYLAHPHTGSRSTARALLQLGFMHKYTCPKPQQGLGSHHATLYENGVVTPQNRGEWFVFTTVRNHFDLLVSRVWKFGRRGDVYVDMDWDDAALFEHAMRPTFWITKNTLFDLHRHGADRVMRFETLTEDLAEIVGPVKLPRIGGNPLRRRRHHREFYTPETRALVEDRFGDEMRELGYSFDQAEVAA